MGHRARFAHRQNAQISARRAGGPRRTWPTTWANARRSMPSWACCSSGWKKPASSNGRSSSPAAITACRACPRGKCNLYDHGVAVTLAMRVPGGKGGRVIDDFVRLPDLAPTFMEIGGVTPPAGLYGKSLLPLLTVGQERPDRSRAQLGRHRPRAACRPGPRRQPALSDAGAAHARLPLHPQFRPRSLADGLAGGCRRKNRCPPKAAWKATPSSRSPTWTPARRRPG